MGTVNVVLTDFERTLVRLFEESRIEQEFFDDVWSLCARRGVPTRVLETAGGSPYSLWTKAHQWMSAPWWKQSLRLRRPNDPLHVERMYHAISAIATKYEMTVTRSVRLFDDVQPVLESLKIVGIPVVIVSNNATEAVDRILKENQAEGLVTGIFGRDFRHTLIGNLKPKPYLLLAALRYSGRDAGTALLVGDSVDDMKAGRAAGIPFRVGLLQHSTFSANQLRKAGADLVLNSFGDLLTNEQVRCRLDGDDASRVR